jgi:hypothetical protein
MTSDHSSGTHRREHAAAETAGARPALSRKQALLVLGTGAMGAAAAAFAGCESDPPPPPDPGRTDVETLNGGLGLEYAGAAVYRAEPDFLGSELRAIARQLSRQADERVERLTTLVTELGGTPLESRPDEEYLEKVELTEVEDEDGFVRVAIEVENVAVAGYSDTVAKLSDPELRPIFYELIGNSAAHISVLLGAAGEVQAPDAFVTGQPA